jgi:hypothetical protein
VCRCFRWQLTLLGSVMHCLGEKQSSNTSSGLEGCLATIAGAITMGKHVHALLCTSFRLHRVETAAVAQPRQRYVTEQPCGAFPAPVATTKADHPLAQIAPTHAVYTAAAVLHSARVQATSDNQGKQKAWEAHTLHCTAHVLHWLSEYHLRPESGHILCILHHLQHYTVARGATVAIQVRVPTPSLPTLKASSSGHPRDATQRAGPHALATLMAHLQRVAYSSPPVTSARGFPNLWLVKAACWG